jgi:hypothetical protein
MDPKRALNSKHRPSAWDLSNEIILGMSERFQIALQWLEDLTKLQRHWREERIKYREAGGSPESTTSDSGGGLKEYSAHFEKSHKEFGSLNNSTWKDRVIDRSYTKLEHDQDSDGRTAAPSPDATFKDATFKSERVDASEEVSSVASNSFTAVNGKTQSRPDTAPGSGYAPPPTPGNNAPISNMSQHHEPYAQYPQYPPTPTYPHTAPSYAVDSGMRYTQPAQQHMQSSGPNSSATAGPYAMWAEQNSAQMNLIEQDGSRGLTNSDMQNFMLGNPHTGDTAYTTTYPVVNGVYNDWYGSVTGQEGGYSMPGGGGM